jgi:hypothetical protein
MSPSHKRLLKLRRKAHLLFDKQWKSGTKSRSRAYKTLAYLMGIPRQECHLSMMREAQLMRVIEICTNP